MTDRRAVQQIKICMNKLTNNKNSVNKRIAELIASYSHASVLEYGSVFECWPNLHYYIVNKTESPFFVQVTHLPARVDWVDLFAGIWYSPNFARASRFHRKKVFRPFSRYPYIKKRKKRYMLKKSVYIK